MALLRRFWFVFQNAPAFSPLQLGCGVTAYSFDDACHILNDHISYGDLKIKSVTEDADVNNLDKNHVLPNIGLVTIRGVWFPLFSQIIQKT